MVSFYATSVEPEGKANRNLRLAKKEVIILFLFAEVKTLVCSGGAPTCGGSFFVAVLLKNSPIFNIKLYKKWEAGRDKEARRTRTP